MKIDSDMIKLAMIPILAIIIIIFAFYLDYGNATNYCNYTVTDKAVKNYNKDSKYLIYTVNEDGDVMVFSVEDRLFIGRFNSSDDYARIQIGKTYTFRTIGVRNGFFSTYPDIVEITEVK